MACQYKYNIKIIPPIRKDKKPKEQKKTMRRNISRYSSQWIHLKHRKTISDLLQFQFH